MSVSVSARNIGPIGTAEFTLRRLNVFIGPNNTGKSVFATVIHAAFQPLLGQYYPPVSQLRRLVETKGQEALPFDETKSNDFLVRVLQAGADLRLDTIPKDLEQFLSRQVQDNLQNWGESQLTAELERCFGAPLSEIRRGRTTGAISIRSENPQWQLSIEITGSGARSEIVTPPDLSHLLALLVSSRTPREAARRRSLPLEAARRRHLQLSEHFLPYEVAENLFTLCFHEFPRRSRYLPAARSGLLQGHKALAGFLISRSSLAGIRDLQIPALSGVVAEFLSNLVTVDQRQLGEYRTAAKQLEADVLKGEVQLAPTPGGSPEIHFVQQKKDFPLHRTSSMVSEVAPVVIYLRHLLRRDDLLIIEEPEAHLHPKSQVIFAQVLVQLTNRGARVLLTTHSEFFLQQLNNAILADRVDHEGISSAGMLPNARVSSKNVGAYLFIDRKTGGNVAAPLEVTSDGGISEAGFVSVAESLYDQTIQLGRLAEKN